VVSPRLPVLPVDDDDVDSRCIIIVDYSDCRAVKTQPCQVTRCQPRHPSRPLRFLRCALPCHALYTTDIQQALSLCTPRKTLCLILCLYLPTYLLLYILTLPVRTCACLTRPDRSPRGSQDIIRALPHATTHPDITRPKARTQNFDLTNTVHDA
jgi:hypothetical protein